MPRKKKKTEVHQLTLDDAAAEESQGELFDTLQKEMTAFISSAISESVKKIDLSISAGTKEAMRELQMSVSASTGKIIKKSLQENISMVAIMEKKLERMKREWRKSMLEIIKTFCESHSMRELARLSDKSADTISRVYHDDETVPDETVKEIFEVVKKAA